MDHLGGIYDRYVDQSRHRVCDVFPTEEGIAEAGWHSQADSDLLAAYGPSPGRKPVIASPVTSDQAAGDGGA